jgi:uncharacterized protein
MVKLITSITRYHKNVLVHVHQYEKTTILHKTLQEHLKNVRVISDKTNYYEHPINYKTEYPDIDALISLSQCAGFGTVNAGEWIVPTGFMSFDVKHNIIHTTIKTVPNNIVPYVKFPYYTGNILVVDDLWNPDLKQQSGVLLFDSDDEKVLSFVKRHTQIFDESHDYRHALAVAYNSTKILNNKFVLYLALLHDVCDHKYKQLSLSRELLRKYIYENLEHYKIIDEMIDQVSFSKQKSFEKVDLILEAVRNGDRVESIGCIGVNRCIQYVESINGLIPKDVVQHCYDKLLRLVPEGYITTKTPDIIYKHNIIVKYVHDHIKESGLDYELPKYL